MYVHVIPGYIEILNMLCWKHWYENKDGELRTWWKRHEIKTKSNTNEKVQTLLHNHVCPQKRCIETRDTWVTLFTWVALLPSSCLYISRSLIPYIKVLPYSWVPCYERHWTYSKSENVHVLAQWFLIRYSK